MDPGSSSDDDPSSFFFSDEFLFRGFYDAFFGTNMNMIRNPKTKKRRIIQKKKHQYVVNYSEH
jgi:hypothetical protein